MNFIEWEKRQKFNFKIESFKLIMKSPQKSDDKNSTIAFFQSITLSFTHTLSLCPCLCLALYFVLACFVMSAVKPEYFAHEIQINGSIALRVTMPIWIYIYTAEQTTSSSKFIASSGDDTLICKINSVQRLCFETNFFALSSSCRRRLCLLRCHCTW